MFTTTPRRMFLCDAVATASASSKDFRQRYVRLMGVVVSADCQGDNIKIGPALRRTSFVIDDGTGMIDVLIDENACGSAGLIGNPTVLLGKTVDCVGSLVRERQSLSEGGGRISSPSRQHTAAGGNACQLVKKQGSVGFDIDAQRGSHNAEAITWLSAESISFVHNPNAETLRYLEICACRQRERQNNSGTGGNVVDSDFLQDDGSGVFIAGSIMSGDKIGTFHYEYDAASNGTDTTMAEGRNHQKRPHFQKRTLKIKSEDAFRLIKCSKSDGGLTKEDLALVLGCQTSEEILAVQCVLQELQASGEIYQDTTSVRGAYKPL